MGVHSDEPPGETPLPPSSQAMDDSEESLSPIETLRHYAAESGLELIEGVDDENIFLAPLEYAEGDNNEVFSAEEELEMEVAADSGCVAHCTHPESLPASVTTVKHPPGTKDFMGAGGESIKRHGKAALAMEMADGGMVGNVMQVAEVTRPLHSISQIADTDKDVLFTKGECVVVPGGSLAKYVKGLRVYAKYMRKGGLYVAKMKFRDPAKLGNKSFVRQGQR